MHRKSKVAELYATILTHEQILGFDVCVHDLPHTQIAQRNFQFLEDCISDFENGISESENGISDTLKKRPKKTSLPFQESKAAVCKETEGVGVGGETHIMLMYVGAASEHIGEKQAGLCKSVSKVHAGVLDEFVQIAYLCVHVCTCACVYRCMDVSMYVCTW
jgi:hypothetical protein